jgi:hypothetical protein
MIFVMNMEARFFLSLDYYLPVRHSRSLNITSSKPGVLTEFSSSTFPSFSKAPEIRNYDVPKL